MSPAVWPRLEPETVTGTNLDAIDPTVLAQVEEIVRQVRTEGWPGLKSLAARLDRAPQEALGPLVLRRDALKAAFDGLDTPVQELLTRVADRIQRFARTQRASVCDTELPIPGGVAGQSIAPVRRAGCYAPAGRHPLPSSVLMTALTARCAGVQEVWVASPGASPLMLAAAWVAGADAFLSVGGAQAIAALAYGVGPVPAMDVIVGPGNAWVTAAKKLVSGHVRIDMLAGPSELVVWADQAADPELVAADLLAQAEHDPMARPFLVTDSERLCAAVRGALAVQLEALPTAGVAREALTRGGEILCEGPEQALAVIEALAPEHLELMGPTVEAMADRIQNYGGLFIGAGAAEVLGDYGIGPNHVLPTGGTARYTGGLSVFDFLRIRTWLRIDDPAGAEEATQDAVALAELEALAGHAAAARLRVCGPR